VAAGKPELTNLENNRNRAKENYDESARTPGLIAKRQQKRCPAVCDRVLDLPTAYTRDGLVRQQRENNDGRQAQPTRNLRPDNG
jgi:hypothetical protein